MVQNAYHWWQRGIIYQIYPRSFQDSNGDGIGDLRGILMRLDYLRWLGANAIWLSPFYPSPMADFGYDVSDYTNVDPLFGTLADFDALVAEAHRLDLKVILDYVPNHTSDHHPWFLESHSSRNNPKSDWFLWRDPAPDGGLPNNWLSAFGGSAWTFDPTRGQYYCHTYLVQQPDLNWRNPKVEAAMLDVLRFWFERGVDGFRIDALRQIIKDAEWRDNPPNPDYDPAQGAYDSLLPVYTTDLPEVHAKVAAMRRVADAFGGRLLIGELYLPIEQLVTYYGVNGSELQLPFNFHLIRHPWSARAITRLVEAYEAALPAGAWPNWVLGNHDRHRIATRVGERQARVAAMLLLTIRGTPTMYYGDEIGMHDVPISPERVQDPLERNEPGRGLGRDPERTPMQWNSSLNAGFTSGVPWLSLAQDANIVNVADERADPTSMLSLYHRLIDLRRSIPALAVGSLRIVFANGDVLAYIREQGGARFLIALNLGAAGQEMILAEAGRLVLSTHLDRSNEEVGGKLGLRADEGVVLQLTENNQ